MNQLRDGQFEGLYPFLLLETRGKNTLETDSCQSVLPVGLDSDRGPKYVTEGLCTTQPQIWPHQVPLQEQELLEGISPLSWLQQNEFWKSLFTFLTSPHFCVMPVWCLYYQTKLATENFI